MRRVSDGRWWRKKKFILRWCLNCFFSRSMVTQRVFLWIMNLERIVGSTIWIIKIIFKFHQLSWVLLEGLCRNDYQSCGKQSWERLVFEISSHFVSSAFKSQIFITWSHFLFFITLSTQKIFQFFFYFFIKF